MIVEILLAVLIVLVIINIALSFKKSSFDKFEQMLEGLGTSLKDEFQRNRKEGSELSSLNREEQSKSLNTFASKFSDNIKDIEKTIEKHLKAIREDNAKQLDEMRKTVDEKLQTTLEKRLGESFKLVSERLELVHKGLGEMQNIASGVGDLKKVLTNVKTRGILGEYQLENILEQVLNPDQYSKNVATKKGSQANVEFAIKLPGKESDKVVWIPVDSKFPIEDYQALVDSYETSDKAIIEKCEKVLVNKVKSFAKDISGKYIDPPHTTDFAIMFLPIESLYAEVLRHVGLFETLQRDYKIIITGPTTLSAVLSSLQMGFRTLAVQKRSSEVWDILKEVKTEFGQFSDYLGKVQKHLDSASSSLETLRSTRTNVMERKLKNVETDKISDNDETLGLPEPLEMEQDSDN